MGPFADGGFPLVLLPCVKGEFTGLLLLAGEENWVLCGWDESGGGIELGSWDVTLELPPPPEA